MYIWRYLSFLGDDTYLDNQRFGRIAFLEELLHIAFHQILVRYRFLFAPDFFPHTLQNNRQIQTIRPISRQL